MPRIQLTREGFNKLRTELEYLMGAKRREIAKDLEKARAFGDLRENAEYDSAKNAQALNEKRIFDLNEKLTSAELIDEATMDKDKILIGATATLLDVDEDEELKYMFVAEAEADYNENKISVTSPIGKALLGKKVGEQVQIEVPAGTLQYKVLKIER